MRTHPRVIVYVSTLLLKGPTEIFCKMSGLIFSLFCVPWYTFSWCFCLKDGLQLHKHALYSHVEGGNHWMTCPELQ